MKVDTEKKPMIRKIYQMIQECIKYINTTMDNKATSYVNIIEHRWENQIVQKIHLAYEYHNS